MCVCVCVASSILRGLADPVIAVGRWGFGQVGMAVASLAPSHGTHSGPPGFAFTQDRLCAATGRSTLLRALVLFQVHRADCALDMRCECLGSSPSVKMPVHLGFFSRRPAAGWFDGSMVRWLRTPVAIQRPPSAPVAGALGLYGGSEAR